MYVILMKVDEEDCLLSSIIDITDRIENEKKILELFRRDLLTNLYNHRFTYQKLKKIIEKTSK